MEPVAVPGTAILPGTGYFVPGPGGNIRRPADTFLRGHGFKTEFFNLPVTLPLQKMKVLVYPVFYLWNKHNNLFRKAAASPLMLNRT
jgi:hypothetical protein